jgi:hypothetical protein
MLRSKLMGATVVPFGIQYVGSTVGFADDKIVTVSLTNLTGGGASSPAPGDFVLAWAGCSSSTLRIVAISGDVSGGYNFLGTTAQGGSAPVAILTRQWKVMGSTPDTSITAEHNGSTADTTSVYVSVWRGVDGSSPVASSEFSGSSSTLIADPPSITPSVSGSFIVVVGLGAGLSGSVQSNGVYTSSDLSDFRSVGGGADTRTSVIGGGYKEWEGGAFGPATFGISNITDSASLRYTAVAVALRPE